MIDVMRSRLSRVVFCGVYAALSWSALAADRRPPDRAYQDFAMGRDGDVSRGRQLFADEQKAACIKCHTVDGSSGRAGPDLFAIGDKFPRRELIRSILEP